MPELPSSSDVPYQSYMLDYLDTPTPARSSDSRVHSNPAGPSGSSSLQNGYNAWTSNAAAAPIASSRTSVDNSYSATVPAVMFPIAGATRPGDGHFISPNSGHALPPNKQAPSTISSTNDYDTVAGFLRTMPGRGSDPAAYSAWTELVHLKTRSLELQIAEARMKEREAELELARLKAGVNEMDNVGSAPVDIPIRTTEPGVTVNLPSPHREFNRLALSGYGAGLNVKADQPVPEQANTAAAAFSDFPFVAPQLDGMHANDLAAPPAQTPMTPYDLEVMMQEDNLDSLFAWLPNYNNSLATSQPNQSNTIDPSMLSYEDLQTLNTPFEVSANTTSPQKRRSVSPSSDNSDREPPSKRKKTLEKKIVIDHSVTCISCNSIMGRIMIRGPKSSIPSPTSPAICCPACRPIEVIQRGTMIGTVDSRKRLRVGMEVDDEDNIGSKRLEEEGRRVFCDVCQRVVGSGRVWGGIKGKRENLEGMTEIVCAGCDGKYQRCTDCGGGGGPRVGIGKWRMKQVFQPGRKTCSLSHSRLGDRPREIGVHITPTDYTPEQLEQVVAKCKGLWNEKTLSRLAVPEMLEIDLPPNLINPLQTYEDVEEIVTGNWPSREAMIRAEGADPKRFKRVLGLTWAQAKPRRNARTVDLEEEYAKSTEAEPSGDMSTVLANIKKTNIIIPAGHELVGMWGGEWDMQHGALLISTLIPFEGADGEDSTALSVGEMITKVQTLRLELNAVRAAEAGDGEAHLIPQCEHLWVVSGGTMPLVRERLADILIRKRSFVHVDEYLVRHPDFINALQARPYGLHPDIQSDSTKGEQKETQKPLVLVRWLGKDFDSQKILEIKQQEFGGGGKARIRKRAKSKA